LIFYLLKLFLWGSIDAKGYFRLPGYNLVFWHAWLLLESRSYRPVVAYEYFFMGYNGTIYTYNHPELQS